MEGPTSFQRIYRALLERRSRPRSFKLWEEVRHCAGNTYGLTPEDVFVVSYPRSGNTWLRVIIAHILYSHDKITSLRDLQFLVPDIHRGIPTDFDYSTPRVIKSHRPYPFRHGWSDPALYSRVLYVVRHPYDVIRSVFHYTQYKERSLTLDETAYRILLGDTAWGSWQDHVLSWKARESERDVHFIRYEDLEERPVEIVLGVADFLGRPINEEQAAVVVQRSSREAMVGLEKRGTLERRDFEFVRRQPVRRELDDTLTGELKGIIADCCKVPMERFGYRADR